MTKMLSIFTICLSILFICHLSDADSFEDAIDEQHKGFDCIDMILFQRSPDGSSKSFEYPVLDAENLIKHMNMSQPFVLYIHGYAETTKSESVQTILSAYLDRGVDNIVILDWVVSASGPYDVVAQRSRSVSAQVAEALERLVKNGLNIENVHIVGHSLGAQVAGLVSKHTDLVIPRITALDPAFPLFYVFGVDHIGSKSAAQVDVIHTDSGLVGVPGPTGTVDFFPNGGCYKQPGCPVHNSSKGFLHSDNLCGHWRSWRIFAESVQNPQAFPAVKCDSYTSFRNGTCNDNTVVFAGYSLPSNATGEFYFNTNDESPFGRGFAGFKELSKSETGHSCVVVDQLLQNISLAEIVPFFS